MLLFRNAKTGEPVVGAENRVEQCHYAAVITRVQEELDNELTGGWKVVEVRGHFSPHTSIGLILQTPDGTQVGSCISLVLHVVRQLLCKSTSWTLKPSTPPYIII